MVSINVAYTQAVNPSGVTPVLTREQVWSLMERKVRKPYDFVPVFESCEIIEEHDNVVVRDTKMKPGPGRPNTVNRETCKMFKPVKVDFHQSSGTIITNTLSDGAGMTDEELMMTYSFEWLHPQIEAGSDKEKEVLEQCKKTAKMSVDKSIEAMRRIVSEGEL